MEMFKTRQIILDFDVSNLTKFMLVMGRVELFWITPWELFQYFLFYK